MSSEANPKGESTEDTTPQGHIERTVGERSLASATLGQWREDHAAAEYRIGLLSRDVIEENDARPSLDMNLPALAHPLGDGGKSADTADLYYRYAERFEHEDEPVQALETLRSLTQSRDDVVLVSRYSCAAPYFDVRPVVVYALRTGETPTPDELGFFELLREVYAEDGRAYDPDAAGYHAEGEPGRIVAKLSDGDTPEDARNA